MLKIIINKEYQFELKEELVERKGIGHPDTICDAIAEYASRVYSNYFKLKYGKLAHHWFDKVMLIGGASDIGYGKGKLLIPYKIIFAGKCVKKVENQDVPLMDIFRQACNDILSKVLTGFNIETDLIIIDETVNYHGAGRKSKRYIPENIEELVDFNEINLVSNDCNLLSCHYPLTTLEKLVLDLENYINGEVFKREFVESGWDVKIVGTKSETHIELIINIPILASLVANYDDYLNKISKIESHLKKYCMDTYNYTPRLIINPQDMTGCPYLTALGSAADTGDVGVVGRGNRVNGLITPMKSMSIEAAAGKNPVDHTGKIYGILCGKLAKKIFKVSLVPVEVHIFTFKEAPLNLPPKIIINFDQKHDNFLNDFELKKKCEKICEEELSNIQDIIKEFIETGVTMW